MWLLVETLSDGWSHLAAVRCMASLNVLSSLHRLLFGTALFAFKNVLIQFFVILQDLNSVEHYST